MKRSDDHRLVRRPDPTRRGRQLILAAAVLALTGFAVRRFSMLPRRASSGEELPFVETRDTRLARALDPLVSRHGGLTGVHALVDGHDAFAARVLLADAAERSLDVQYYIWEKDLTGTLLFDALLRAADRGVRVRLLLDDNNTQGLDLVLSALDAHDGIEVRLFNPFVWRKLRLIGYATDFHRLNRRMHNKSFTADGRATVIGGRNVADHYFAAGDGSLFMDLDVLAIGPAVAAVAESFERYWTSRSAYPVSAILPRTGPAQIAALRADAAAVMNDAGATKYLDAVRDRTFVSDSVSHDLPLDWAEVRLLTDDPAKGLDAAKSGGLLIDNLSDALGDPERELTLISGYFVPSSTLMETLRRFTARGVDVRILTNALDATDVKIVNAGYGAKRASLLDAGVRLYEVRGSGSGKMRKKRVSPSGSGSIGSGGSTLHAKTFTVDRERIFIGSFNLDPRSERLNTEQGFVISSPALAARISDKLTEVISDVAYEVRNAGGGRLRWLETRDGHVVTHDLEPGSSWYERALLGILSRLPIAWLL